MRPAGYAIDAVISRYQAGHTPTEIIQALDLRISTEGVRAALRRHNVPLRGPGGRNNPNGSRGRAAVCPWAAAELTCRLRKNTPEQIAVGLGVPRGAVQRWGREAGLDLLKLARERRRNRKGVER